MLLILSFSSDSDREKFDYLFVHYKTMMLHKAQGILRSLALAEDAVSEAFLRIYRNLDKIDDPASPRSAAFVFTVVRNAALTLLEREKARSGEPVDEALPDECNVETQVLSRISTDEIMQLVDSIGDDLRGPFLLKYAHGMSHREIAGMLGISENNVTVRVHRARKKLSALLVKEGYAGERV